MKLSDVEIYEGDKPPVKTDLNISKVLVAETGSYEIRLEISDQVIYIYESEIDQLVYLLENAK